MAAPPTPANAAPPLAAPEGGFGAALMAQADDLAAFSQDAPKVTRTFLSPEHRQAADYVIGLMRAAGMAARVDDAGNVVGRYDPKGSGKPAILTGSHIDSVRDAGRYDGLFGILCPIAAVRWLHENAVAVDYPIEVVAFGDEEGVRFGATLIGSKALGGTLAPEALDLRDAAGTTMREALGAFGLDAGRTLALRRDPASLACFVEVHIEQGPVLLDEGLPVGTVTSIAGASRFRFTVEGLAGHAGTVPMPLRRDAYAAAAEMALAVETRCKATPGLVGTVGVVETPGGAINTIPGKVRFTLDIRAGEDAIRKAAIVDVMAALNGIAARRRVTLGVEPIYEAPAAPCAPWLMAQLDAAIARTGVAPRRLPSGAGHDAMAIAAVADIAMLFVRCGNGGISHHPDETMTAADADLATRVLIQFLLDFKPKDAFRG